MMTLKCKCGAKYRLPESAAGKRGKCKKCGGVFTVPARKAVPVAAVEDDLYALAGGDAVARPQSEMPADGPDSEIPEPLRIPSPEAAREREIETERPREGKASIAAYLAAVRNSSFQLVNVGNAITLAFIVVVMAASFVLWFAPMYGMIGLAMIYGYYYAFLLNAARDAAGGEDELTQPPLEDGLWDGFFLPAIQFGLTYLVTLLPPYLYLGAALSQSNPDLLTGELLSPYQVLLDEGLTTELVIFVLLQFAGLFIWPMYILVVAVGGSILAISRFDLIVKTIVKTLPAYIVTVALVYLAQGMPLAAAAIQEAAGGGESVSGMIGLHMLRTAIQVVAMVIAMRAIGLYYHHFKRKFAWSWG